MSTIPSLYKRAVKGSPLSQLEGDFNTTTVENAINAMFAQLGVVLNADGTLKDDTVSTDTIVDRAVTVEKLAFASNFYALNTGGADALAVSFTPSLTAYEVGQVFFVETIAANTTGMTLEVNGQGAKQILRDGATVIEAGETAANHIMVLAYDGTAFQYVNRIVSDVPAFVPIFRGKEMLVTTSVVVASWTTINLTTWTNWMPDARYIYLSANAASEDGGYSLDVRGSASVSGLTSEIPMFNNNAHVSGADSDHVGTCGQVLCPVDNDTYAYGSIQYRVPIMTFPITRQSVTGVELWASGYVV